MKRAMGVLAVGAVLTMALGPAAFGSALAAEKTSGAGAGAAAKAAPSAAWSPEADCAACHVNEETACSDEKALASRHAALELACVDCHTDEKGLVKGHKKAKEGVVKVKRLKKSEIDPEVCLTCHKQEDLIKATADLDVLTDTKGTTVNPHKLPDVVEHEGVSCASCHYMHRDKSATEAAPAVCNGCHHDGVYECFSCHA